VTFNMKGVAFAKVGAPATLVEDLEMPEPADDQILVKSIYTAINPIDGLMANMGILIVDWPFILGCDAAGVVIKAGSKAVGPIGPFKVGDEVCGCTRLGSKGYSTCQEYFLMDAALTIPKPKNISLAQAATVGVGFYSACLGVFHGLHIPVPSPDSLPAPSGEWAVITGGASSVGKYAVQLLKALGFKVVTTCSANSAQVLKELGADATIDYKKPEEEQIEELLSITDGQAGRIFDAVACNEGFAMKVFEKIEGQKWFATTNDWTPMPASSFSGGTPYGIEMGTIGRPDSPQLNATMSSFIPLIHSLMESGKVVPSEYVIIGEGKGIESAMEAYAFQQAGKGGNKKVLAKLQDE